jgi:hypothetical protein
VLISSHRKLLSAFVTMKAGLAIRLTFNTAQNIPWLTDGTAPRRVGDVFFPISLKRRRQSPFTAASSSAKSRAAIAGRGRAQLIKTSLAAGRRRTAHCQSKQLLMLGLSFSTLNR